MGMIIISILGTLLSTAATKHDRAAHHLDDTRAATRQAESALLTMQAGQAAITCESLTITKLPDSSTQIPGMTWVEVQATVNARTATLIGLVPESSIPAGAK
jgi:type II secretory pathway pseudopilin PulG